MNNKKRQEIYVLIHRPFALTAAICNSCASLCDKRWVRILNNIFMNTQRKQVATRECKWKPWQWHRQKTDEDIKITCWLGCVEIQYRKIVLHFSWGKWYVWICRCIIESIIRAFTCSTHIHTHTYRLQYRLATSVPRQPPPLSCTLVFVQIYREKLNEPLDNLHEGNLQAISAKCVCRRSKNVKPQRCYSHKINSDSMRSSPSILKHFSWRISPL